jgi:predicted Rossmann fold nucleotide-binding protein DprA/Smf involved in DNA uptake
MKKLKKDLQAVSKSLNALAKKTETLMKKVGKLEKTQAVKKRKPKTKAKPAKKATPKRKATEMTATDHVVKIVKRSKKGVDAPTLIKKTGFEDKKIRNILFRASKQGKIKRTGRGMYVGA